MNSNTISTMIGGPGVGPREGNQGGTGSSETQVTFDGTNVVICPFPALSLLGTHVTTWAANNNPGGPQPSIRFKVLAVGRTATGTTSNVTIKMYFGTSNTIGSNTAIATTGAVSLATAKSPWQIEVVGCYDADSKIIDGYYSTSLNGTRTGQTIITNAVTAVDPTTQPTTKITTTTTPAFTYTVPAYGFNITFTFGTGNAGNKFYLDWFVVMID